jgi:hypothetical protein
MSATNDNLDERRMDEGIRAFLAREATRRATRHRTADQALEAIPFRSSTRTWPRSLAVAASLLLIIAILGTRGLIGFMTAGSSASPAAITMPTLAPGEPCPVTAPSASANGEMRVIGGGQIRLSLTQQDGTVFFETTPGASWNAIEVIWTAPLGFVGKATVHGQQLDGPGDLRFGDPTDPLTSLVIGGSAPSGAIGNREVIASTELRVKSSGCYGLEIEVNDESDLIVFRAAPIADAFRELERGLHLPTVSAGYCPVSPPAPAMPFVEGLFGQGPVYVTGGGILTLSGEPQSGGAWLVNQAWVSSPSELGPILVRGARIDQPGKLAFGPEPLEELRLPIRSFEHTPGQPAGWRIFNQYVRPTTVGCYAMQVDTLSGTTWIVFRVTG